MLQLNEAVLVNIQLADDSLNDLLVGLVLDDAERALQIPDRDPPLVVAGYELQGRSNLFVVRGQLGVDRGEHRANTLGKFFFGLGSVAGGRFLEQSKRSDGWTGDVGSNMPCLFCDLVLFHEFAELVAFLQDAGFS